TTGVRVEQRILREVVAGILGEIETGSDHRVGVAATATHVGGGAGVQAIAQDDVVAEEEIADAGDAGGPGPDHDPVAGDRGELEGPGRAVDVDATAGGAGAATVVGHQEVLEGEDRATSQDQTAGVVVPHDRAAKGQPAV